MSGNNVISFISKSFQDSVYIWRSEMTHVYKDSGVLIFFIVLPILYPAVYGLIYGPELVRKVDVTVVDQSRSFLSREYVRRLNAAQDVHVYSYSSDMKRAKVEMDKKNVYGIIYIPYDFSKKINSGEQTHVQVYCDMGALLRYRAIYSTAVEVANNLAKDRILQTLPGLSYKNQNLAVQPIAYDWIALFNPSNGFESFILPAILIIIIQQSLMLGICMLSGTNREQNHSGLIIPMSQRYNGTMRIIMGRAAAYFTIYVLISFWDLVVNPYIYHLPQIAPYGAMTIFTLPYLLSCIFFAMTISYFMKGRETPMMIFVALSVPILFISGISWPESAVPTFWKYVSYIFPSTFGIQGIVKLNSLGAELNMVSTEYKMLWVLCGFYFITTVLLYRIELNKKFMLTKNRNHKE